MSAPRKLPALVWALLWLPLGVAAAPPKHPLPAAQKKKPLTKKPVPKQKPLRIITTRVTAFYSFKDKKKHKVHPLAAVSKTLNVKVVKRKKGK